MAVLSAHTKCRKCLAVTYRSFMTNSVPVQLASPAWLWILTEYSPASVGIHRLTVSFSSFPDSSIFTRSESWGTDRHSGRVVSREYI